MNVVAFLIANTKASILTQPRKIAFYHPAVDTKSAAIFAPAFSKQGNNSSSAKFSSMRLAVITPGYKLIFDKDIKVAHYRQTNLFKYLKEQYHHGYWRKKLYRLHPDMAKGDSYAGILDFIQPPLAMAIIGTGIISFFYRPLFSVPFLLVVLLLALQLPITLTAVIKNRQYSYLCLLLILFLRAFARGVGMLKGIWRFFVLEALRNEDR